MKEYKTIGNQVLKIDLSVGKEIVSIGYDSGISGNNKKYVTASTVHRINGIHIYIHGEFYSRHNDINILKWLDNFNKDNIGEWVEYVDAEFNVVVWDVNEKEIWCIGDRVGAHRLYMHASGGLVTITDTLVDQIRLQEMPSLDGFGVYTMLTMYYPLDPYTLLANTKSIGIGSVGVSSGLGIEYSTYYYPVKTDVENYRSINKCVMGIEKALIDNLEKSVNSRSIPMIMLSGGIDSLVLLNYMHKIKPGKVEALTFETEGQEKSELHEARIAARYYDIPHKIVTIRKSDIKKAAIHALVYGDGSSLHSAIIRDSILSDGRALDIYRGEDTRLHTPTLDWPTRIGIFIHGHQFNKSKIIRALWDLRRIIRLWSFQRGRNYISYILAKTELYEDLHSYIIRSCLRYHVPANINKGKFLNRLIEETKILSGDYDIDSLNRKIISIAYRLQYTENMRWAAYASNTENSRLILPYYDPEVCLACNKVSFSMAMKQMLVSPKKTRSPFLLVDKYILRKLVDKQVPDELLYRRKSVPGDEEVTYPILWDMYRPILELWGRSMNEDMVGENKYIVSYYINKLDQKGKDAYKCPRLAYVAHCLAYLSMLHWLCQNQGADLKAELELLSETGSDH